MSYSAPNTPNPSSNTQIGFAMDLSANMVTTITANVTASSITKTFNIPIGKWIIVGYCLVAGTSNANVAIGGNCSIKESGTGGTIFCQSGFSSPSQPISYMYLNPTGCFYSNGNLNIDVTLNATSNSSTAARTSALLQIIKIA